LVQDQSALQDTKQELDTHSFLQSLRLLSLQITLEGTSLEMVVALQQEMLQKHLGLALILSCLAVCLVGMTKAEEK
jgi:hypothetical protein